MLFSILFLMENNIMLMDAPFDGEKITLCNPNGIQGGSYMTKLNYCGTQSLYFQTPKIKTKQGIVITDKKQYFDIMIDNNNSELISWVESLEECLQKKIYEKRNLWFETELDMEDIQNTMTPILRPYKGGKYHLMRISIPIVKNIVGQNRCAIYDENENIIGAKDVSDNKMLISILEIQGIKFSSKYFQVDIQAKQIMMFNDISPFKTCMIKRSPEQPAIELPATEPQREINVGTTSHDPTSHDPTSHESFDNILISNDGDNIIPVQDNSRVQDNSPVQDNSRVQNNSPIKTTIDEIESESKAISDLDNIIVSSNTLEEVSIDLENNMDEDSDVLELKSKEFYYDIYRIALEKAKKAKRQALESFLEAKKIKETYMLDEIENDSLDEENLEDSDFDEEYEELY